MEEERRREKRLLFHSLNLGIITNYRPYSLTLPKINNIEHLCLNLDCIFLYSRSFSGTLFSAMNRIRFQVTTIR